MLYLVMELTVRLGIATGKGHAELVKDCFGRKWAFLSVALLLVSTTGALVTELAGLAGVGLMEGIPPRVTVPAAAVFLALVVMSGSYRRVERIGLALGLFELAFLFAALRAHPSLHAAAASFGSVGPLSRGDYLGLVAANVGAVIMPWMVFYQQAAVVDKGLRRENLRAGRVDTAVGAVVTQVVMIAVLVATAATLNSHSHSHVLGAKAAGQAVRTGGSLTSVQAISAALVPYLGTAAGKLAFGLGMAGAALVAAIVVSLAGGVGLRRTDGGAPQPQLPGHPGSPLLWRLRRLAGVGGRLDPGVSVPRCACRWPSRWATPFCSRWSSGSYWPWRTRPCPPPTACTKCRARSPSVS